MKTFEQRLSEYSHKLADKEISYGRSGFHDIREDVERGANWCKEEMMKDVQELVEALKRRQKSDDECGHHFDENISTALLNWEKKYGKN